MKKIIMGVAAVAMLAMGACSKDKAAGDAGEAAVSKEYTDSISRVYGAMVGGYVLSDFKNFNDEHQNDQTREEMIKGVRMAFSQGESEGMAMGLQVGMKMMQEIKQLEDMGVPVDRNLVLSNFIEAFKADTVDMHHLRELSNSFSTAMAQASEMQHKKEMAERANSPEAQQNAISGKAFLDKKRTEEGVQATASGLLYKIDVAGDTTAIAANAPLDVIYKGMLIDGTVFDQSAEPVKMAPAGVIPGFGEGMKLIGKGGKGTLYIPAELAYGVEAPDVIGPNQTLVFEIEVGE